MFEGSSDFLAYALVLFLGWVYLPYTFFKFSAEIFIDLGRRRDSTPLEEIISAFLPSVLLNLQALLIFKICSIHNDANFSIDFAVMAAMFGNRQGSVSVSDYIYAGNWWGPALYLGFLWALAIGHGIGFGIVTRRIAETKGIALHGMEPVTMRQIKRKCQFPAIVRYIWFVWFAFFRESFVPLFTWRAKAPRIRVEMKDKTVYIGKLAGYEKTTEGKLEAVRLKKAKRYRSTDGVFQETPIEQSEFVDTENYLILWSEVVELRLVKKAPPAKQKEDMAPPDTAVGPDRLPIQPDQQPPAQVSAP